MLSAEPLQPCLTLRPCGAQPTRLLCPWDSPGRNTGVGGHALLQGNLPDPGIGPTSLTSPKLAGRFSTTNEPTWGEVGSHQNSGKGAVSFRNSWSVHGPLSSFTAVVRVPSITGSPRGRELNAVLRRRPRAHRWRSHGRALPLGSRWETFGSVYCRRLGLFWPRLAQWFMQPSPLVLVRKHVGEH